MGNRAEPTTTTTTAEPTTTTTAEPTTTTYEVPSDEWLQSTQTTCYYYTPDQELVMVLSARTVLVVNGAESFSGF